MSPVHSLGQFNPSLRISNRSLECVNITKLLGIHFSEHLYWEKHVHNLSKSCYSVLGFLRRIKKLKTYLTITLEKLKLSRPVWLGTGWILSCEYRREGAYFFLSFVLLLSVLSKLKRTLEKHKVKQARLRSEIYRQLLFYLHFRSLVFWSCWAKLLQWFL